MDLAAAAAAPPAPALSVVTTTPPPHPPPALPPSRRPPFVSVSPTASNCRSLSSSSSILLTFLTAGSASASALSYDDVSLPNPLTPPASLDLDVGAIVDSLTSFVIANPLAVIAGVASVGVPVLISAVFAQPKSWGFVTAKEAFKKLGDQEANVQLLDIRSSTDVKAEGTIDLTTFGKRPLQFPYKGEDESYLKKLLSRVKDPANTTLYILDQFDGNSNSLAKFLAANGFKAAYAIKDGAEGPYGWRTSDFPWLLPRKGFFPDVSSLKDVIDSTLGENPQLVPTTLGVAAAAGVSLVIFSEAETALQLLGSAALVQLFVKKFLFAQDRQKTLKELQAFLDTKIAPKELVDEIKGIGGVLLPKYKELPTVDSTNGALTSEIIEQAEETPALVAIPEQVETKASELAVEKRVDSTSSADLPQCPTPLSPFTQFPDLKPPSSPTPSRV